MTYRECLRQNLEDSCKMQQLHGLPKMKENYRTVDRMSSYLCVHPVSKSCIKTLRFTV